MNRAITTDTVRALDRQQRGVPLDGRDVQALRDLEASSTMHIKALNGSAAPDAADDEMDAIIARHGGHHPTPLSCFVMLGKFVNAMNRRNVERNMRLDALERRVAAMEEQAASYTDTTSFVGATIGVRVQVDELPNGFRFVGDGRYATGTGRVWTYTRPFLRRWCMNRN